MKALEAYNKVAKRIIGTSCSGGYFIDVGVDSIVCVTNTRVKCSSWEQYLKKHNADYLLNISFVNSTEEKPSTDLHEDSSPMFTVKEWVYPSIEITDEDINTIVSSIYSTHNGTYEDNTRLHIMPITVDATPREIYVLTWKHDGKEEVLGKEWANSNEAEAAAKSYIVSLYKKNGTIPTINLNRRAYSIIDKERHNPKDFFIKCLSQSNNEEISESNTHKNMKKNTIKINEQQLRKVIAGAIKKTLNEGYPNTENGNAEFFAYERQIMSLIDECDDSLLLLRIIEKAARKLSSLAMNGTNSEDNWFIKAKQWADRVRQEASTLSD